MIHPGVKQGDDEMIKDLNYHVLLTKTSHSCCDRESKKRMLVWLERDSPDLLLVWLTEGNFTNATEPNKKKEETAMRYMLDAVCALASAQLQAGRQVILYGFEHQKSLWGDLNPRNEPGKDPDHPLQPLQELIKKKQLHNVAVRMCNYGCKGAQTGKGSNKVVRIISDHAFADK